MPSSLFDTRAVSASLSEITPNPMPNITSAQMTDRSLVLRNLKTLRSLMTATGRKVLADEADRLLTETLDRGIAYADLTEEVLTFTMEVRATLAGRRSLPPPRSTL